MGSDFVSVLEAVYTEAADEKTWLRGVLDAAAPSLDLGLGTIIGTYRKSGETLLEHLEADYGTGACADWVDAIGLADFPSAVRARPDGESMVRRVYPAQPACGLFSQVSGLGPGWRSDPTFAPFWAAAPPPMRRAVDMLGVIGSSTPNAGAVLVSVVPSTDRISARTLANGSRLASHLATGHRLLRSRRAQPDAVLDPAGHLHHLSAPVAREELTLLSEATHAIEAARGKLRRSDPEAALALWKGLIAGRWTLVDHFDTDGRRYVLAKRNLRERPWEMLSERESGAVAQAARGRSHKLIASALGMSTTSVAMHLARAARKIGARSRIELIAAYRAAHEDATA